MLVVGGLIAGAINAVAGAGSIITLTLLLEVVGLPANVANGTNRIGVFLNAIGSATGYYQARAYDARGIKKYILPTTIGGVIGVVVARYIPNDDFIGIFKFLLIALFLVLLWQPKKWMGTAALKARLSPTGIFILLMLVGFYGGFIQMGMGLFFLGTMVLAAGETLRFSNPLKILSVFIFTIFALILFGGSGLIYWVPGLCLGAGQWIGGWLMSRYQHKIPNSEQWIYRLMIVMVLLSIMKTFGVFQLF